MSDRGKPAGGWRWNIPQCTHHVLPADTVRRLAREPRVLFVLLQVAADRGAAAECARLQEKISALAQIYQQGPWLPALKAACAMQGLGNGRPAPPLAPAAPAAREAIMALLEDAGLGVAAGAARAR